MTETMVDASDHGLLPCVEINDDDVAILDPRCLILDPVGNCLYSPREHERTRFAAWVQEWLRENPDWPTPSHI